MNTPSEYLEAARTQELEREFEASGYRVIHPAGEDRGLDLIAEGHGKRIAVQVKARSELQRSIPEVQRLRRSALERGFDEFRLVLVNPPHQPRIHVEGLQDRLREYAVKGVFPQLEILSSAARVVDIGDLEVSSIEVTDQGTRLSGTGILYVELAYGGPRDHVGVRTDFPFSFDVSLSAELDAMEVNEFSIDTSAYDAEDAA